MLCPANLLERASSTRQGRRFLLAVLFGIGIHLSTDSEAQCQSDPRRQTTDAVLAEMRAPQIEAELATIHGALDGRADSIFFISIFEGYLPVPSRFVYVAREPGRLRSTSPLVGGDSVDSLFSLSGSLHVGVRTEGEDPVENDLPVACEESRLTRHGLEVVERRYNGFSQVVIYDENEYLTLTSDNPGLWEAMIDVWHELRARREDGLRGPLSAAQSAAVDTAAAWLEIVDREGYEVACSADDVAERFDAASCRSSLASLYETERVASRRVSNVVVVPAGLGGNADSRALVVFVSSLATGETEETVIVDLADSPGIIGHSIR